MTLPNEYPTTWDNTMRITLTTCPRKFYFFLKGYDYVSRPVYFVWGEAWHEILRVWHSQNSLPNQEIYWVSAEKAIQAGFQIWDKEAPEEKGRNLRASLETIFRAYLQTYPTELWRVIELGTETGWVWPIKGTPWLLGGSLDARIEWEGYGTLPREDKSTGDYLSDSYCSQWYQSPQVLNYIWYEQQITGGDSCLINMATKNVPGPRSNWTTPRFHRLIVKASPTQLEEHLENSLFDIERGKRDYWDRDYWPKTPDPTNCVGGTGKAPCLFKDFCLARTGKDAWRNLDLSRYSIHIKKRTDPWKPWERRGSTTKE